MNCANHPEMAAAAYCRECGKPLCAECIRRARGSVFCAEHAPETGEPPRTPPFGAAAGFAPAAPGTASSFAAASPYDAPATPPQPEPQSALVASPWTASPPVPPRAYYPGVPPVIALLLGFIPGVGAICNGQYAKGLIHAVIFGLLVSAEASAHSAPVHILCGIMISAWIFYMAFEAFHTASRRRRGLPVEEFSSLFDVRASSNRLPLGAVLLVVVGFILLLETTDIISMELFSRYWPVILIALGIYLLYARVHGAHDASGSDHNVEIDR